MTPVQMWFESWRRTHYDIATREIRVFGNPPLYVLCHERAHLRQHEDRTFLWRAWERLRGIPILGRIAHLHLELDADRRARRALRAGGQWDELNELAARLVLRSIWREHLFP